MLSQSGKLRLKRQAAIYSPLPTKLIIDQSDRHDSQIEQQRATITIGQNACFRYVTHISTEGYQLMNEGFLFHEIAQLIYSDYRVFAKIYNEGKRTLDKANRDAQHYVKKQITIHELKESLLYYVEMTNLPLLLKAIEDGAIENAMGIEHPETWHALMYARIAMIDAFMNEKHDDKDQSFLMDKIMKEIMVICTYGYRFHIKKGIVYLPKYIKDFEKIRKLAIQGRLQTQTTLQRLEIAKEILVLCSPVINKTVTELIDTITKSNQFSSLPDSLFSTNTEIAVSFGNENTSSSPKQTPAKYQIDISQEEFQRIEALEEQNEKVLQQELLQEIAKREKEHQQEKDHLFKEQIDQQTHIQNKITFVEPQLQYLSPYGKIAMRTQNVSISRSNKLARMMKRERMYATKSQTKRKLDYGRKLDQQNLYRATLDGHVFMKHTEGKKKDLCVYILIDTSESMNGEKMVNAMKGCYELARVMQTLNIPFCITSHKTMGSTVQMMKIISFDDCKKRQKLNLIYHMFASGGTHEDIALEQALKELKDYKRHRKGFVFVLSDGDTHGIGRIHALTHFYKKEYDIDIIGIGIQTIQITETYPNHIYVKDLDTLPDMLIQKLKELAI